MRGTLDSTDLRNGMNEFSQKVLLATQMYGETVAKDFESYAKAHRPWTDRTSRARQGLTGYTEDIPKGVEVIIAHTVDYGQYLEFAHEKKYAILEPTVRIKGPEAIEGLRNMFNKIKVR